MKKGVRILCFIVGFCLCTYPLISSFLEGKRQQNTVATFEQALKSSKEEDIEECVNKARKYNQVLFQAGQLYVSNSEGKLLSRESYQNNLNLFGDGVMGSVEIPKISVSIPIYHGTEEEVLSVGAGHLYGSSLPVGGDNTHSVLTGHRGLPNAKLFTRLDELEKGDVFFLYVYNQNLSYMVDEIQVIKPSEKEVLQIREGKDLVSLVTCTPYGINTHRLVVTGRRISEEEGSEGDVKPQVGSPREFIFTFLPFGALLAVGVSFIKKKGKQNICKKE